MQPDASLFARLIASGWALGAIAACTTLATVDLLPEDGSAGSASGSPSSAGGNNGTGSTVTAGGNSGATGGTDASSIGTNGLPVELIHRYDFSGTGTEVVDRAGGTSGAILGAEAGGTAVLDGSGQLSITDGLSYVRLPSWLIKNANSSSITIAIWFTLNRTATWARVFDFGATIEGDNQPGTPMAQFYFTTDSAPNGYYSVVLDNDCTNAAQAVIEPATAFPSVAVPVYVAVVVQGDDTLGTSTLHLYVNGTEVTSALDPAVAQRLTAFPDQNCWLGLSQWTQDNQTFQHFDGRYDEFRIYSRALSAGEITNLSLTDPTKL